MLKKITKSIIFAVGLFFLPIYSSLATSGSDVAAGGAMALIFGSMFGFWLLWMIVVGTLSILNLLGIALWVWMIVDVAKREFKNESDKLMWLLIVILTGWIGALIYYFYVKRKEEGN